MKKIILILTVSLYHQILVIHGLNECQYTVLESTKQSNLVHQLEFSNQSWKLRIQNELEDLREQTIKKSKIDSLLLLFGLFENCHELNQIDFHLVLFYVPKTPTITTSSHTIIPEHRSFFNVIKKEDYKKILTTSNIQKFSQYVDGNLEYTQQAKKFFKKEDSDNVLSSIIKPIKL